MSRPQKSDEDRRDYHLRVPLNDAEQAVIEEAVKLDGELKAGWARRVLLAAARKRVGKTQARTADGGPK